MGEVGNTIDTSFFDESEVKLINQFLQRGYVIANIDNIKPLDQIRFNLCQIVADFLGDSKPTNIDSYLNNIHVKVGSADINELRLNVFSKLNSETWFRQAYYSCAKYHLDILVGNELAMQKKINLSVQMPNDTSSVLPIHADVWAGDSPYEVVLWIPFVDVSRSKSMFILPQAENDKHMVEIESQSITSAEDIMEKVEPDLKWLDIRYGQCLLFSQNILHGNITNTEKTTRWSMNCRFKSIFSPYADKRLGEFFDPITIRPATLMGARYNLPNVRS